ncbi:MANBL protein, partial [Polyodon spathula]|nr:MANBL protein [Polyodon spathula]
MAGVLDLSAPEIPEPTFLESVLRYGLFLGALFQIICILAVIIPSSKLQESGLCLQLTAQAVTAVWAQTFLQASTPGWALWTWSPHHSVWHRHQRIVLQLPNDSNEAEASRGLLCWPRLLLLLLSSHPHLMRYWKARSRCSLAIKTQMDRMWEAISAQEQILEPLDEMCPVQPTPALPVVQAAVAG